MIRRPKRRASLTPVHDWASQAIQYTVRTDIERIDGITTWTVPQDEAPVPIICLLAHQGGLLLGILNYYPEGSGLTMEQPGDIMLIIDPGYRRLGIGTHLLTRAIEVWGVDLMSQCYTDEGWELAQSVLRAKA